MGIYLKDAYGFERTPESIMSLIIEQSMRPLSVGFEVKNIGNEWILNWNYEIKIGLLLEKAREYDSLHNMTLKDVFNDLGFKNSIEPLNKIYSCKLTADDIAIIKALHANGLPELTKGKPQGLDGYLYKLSLYDPDREYDCWAVVPEEWKGMIPFIDLCIKKADLGDTYGVYMVR